MKQLMAWLGRGWTPLKIAVIAFALGAPALGVGYVIDDYAHLASFSDVPRLRVIWDSPWDMFSFVTGATEQKQAAMEQGLYPWWTSDRVVLNFWRPLTVLTHGIDHALWPDSPAMAHLQSLLWYAALVALATMLYRMIGVRGISGGTRESRGETPAGAGWTGSAATLAALIFAIDEAHALPMAWVANRNAVLAAFWGVACVLLHVKWRREGKAWALGAALAALAAAVHANEGGIATTGYLFAFAVFLDRGSAAKRLGTLAPYAGVVVAWRAYYSLLGFGAKFAPSYIDPGREPLRFAWALVERSPGLLLGQLVNFPSELFFVLEGAGFAGLWMVVVAGTLAVAAVAMPALRTRESAFWATGMALAIVPVCATFPSNRLLLFAGLGGSALVAAFIDTVSGTGRESFRASPEGAGRARRWLCVAMIAMHLVLAPLAMVGTIIAFGVGAARIRAGMTTVDFPAGVETKTVVIANSPNYFVTAYMAIRRGLEGEAAPAHLYSLSPNNPTAVPTTMTRVDERTLRVAPEGGYPWLLFRSGLEPMSAGDVVRLDGMTVRVVEVNAKGVPQVADYVFPAPLEDERFVWRAMKGVSYVPFGPPAVGETLWLNE